jgi:hypothetical protein
LASSFCIIHLLVGLCALHCNFVSSPPLSPLIIFPSLVLFLFFSLTLSLLLLRQQ